MPPKNHLLAHQGDIMVDFIWVIWADLNKINTKILQPYNVAG